MLQNRKKDYDWIVNRKEKSITNLKSDFIAHIFYFYIFVKEELQTHFEHNRPIRIQGYWAWWVKEVKISKFHLHC